MKFFPKETQPRRFRKETPGHQENQDAVDRKEKKSRKPHKIVIHSCSNYGVKTEKYGERNVDSIPLRP